MDRYEKVSKSLLEYYAENGSPVKGKPGWKHTEEQKEHKRQKSIEAADRRGRVSEAHKKARNKANVYAYRARLRNAIPEDADLKLIRTIYEHCPDGYHVDHIKSLASGGMHHQDNLQYLPAAENCRKGNSRSYDPTLAIDWRTLVE